MSSARDSKSDKKNSKNSVPTVAATATTTIAGTVGAAGTVKATAQKSAPVRGKGPNGGAAAAAVGKEKEKEEIANRTRNAQRENFVLNSTASAPTNSSAPSSFEAPPTSSSQRKLTGVAGFERAMQPSGRRILAKCAQTSTAAAAAKSLRSSSSSSLQNQFNSKLTQTKANNSAPSNSSTQTTAAAETTKAKEKKGQSVSHLSANGRNKDQHSHTKLDDNKTKKSYNKNSQSQHHNRPSLSADLKKSKTLIKQKAIKEKSTSTSTSSSTGKSKKSLVKDQHHTTANKQLLTATTTSPLLNYNKLNSSLASSKVLSSSSPSSQASHKLSSSSSLLSTLSSSSIKSNTDKMTDQSVLDKLEAGYAKLQAATPEQCHSLLKKYLTREVLDKLKDRKTAMGATLLDVAQSGFENLDSGIGIYAPDAESYTLFAELFNPIIEDYHGGFKPEDKHPASDFGDLDSFVNVDPNNEYVISTRVRCGRSLKGYPFNPCLTEAQYKEMEDKVSSTLKEMDGDLAGNYYPLTGMTKETQQQLIDDHFLFKEGDRFLQAANACRYWPTGRGIYHNKEKSFLVWVNEEDHLRIISMQKGGDLKTIFGRLVRGVRAVEAKVPFSRDERLGFLTFCPTNLGTTIRASVHIKLPKLAADLKKLEEVAGKFNLQVRGTSGEHTESIGGVYDISNKRRLGLTEYQAVREMQDGILELIKIEKSL